MHRRSTGALTRLLSVALPGVASIEAQREPHATFWDEWNARSAKEDGPLWVALGDSSSQGIGSEDPHDSWIPQVLDRLRSATSEPWRVINLAITGAQFGDIVQHQLPRIDELRSAGHEPALMTHLAGANNLMAPHTWPSAKDDLRTILDTLDVRSVVARVGIDSAGNSAMARTFNRTINAAAAEKQFELFWPWSWPSRDGMAGDKFHPNPKGYGYMTDIIYPRVRAALDL